MNDNCSEIGIKYTLKFAIKYTMCFIVSCMVHISLLLKHTPHDWIISDFHHGFMCRFNWNQSFMNLLFQVLRVPIQKLSEHFNECLLNKGKPCDIMSLSYYVSFVKLIWLLYLPLFQTIRILIIIEKYTPIFFLLHFFFKILVCNSSSVDFKS